MVPGVALTMVSMNKRSSILIFSILMSAGMTFSMSLALTLINAGLTDFWIRWPRAFVLGFIVSLPTSLIVSPMAKRMADTLTAERE